MFCLLGLPCLFIFAAIKDGIKSRKVDKYIDKHIKKQREISFDGRSLEEIRKVNPYYHMTKEELEEYDKVLIAKHREKCNKK